MTAVFRLLALCLLAGPGFAQSVPIRSGEHETFTRLVFQVPTGVEWNLEQGWDAARLTIDLPEIKFESGAVFSRIPRSRLSDLSQAAPGDPLLLTLACNCSVNGFRQGNKMLVIDISDTPPDYDQLRDVRPHRLASTPYRFRLSNVSRPLQTLPVPRLPLVTERRRKTESVASLAPQLLEPKSTVAGLDVLEKRLLTQIGRAVGQGLVTPKQPMETSVPTSDPSETVSPLEQIAADASESLEQPSLTVSTTIDRDLAAVAKALTGTNDEPTCISSAQLALHDWHEAEPFGERVSRLRSGLVGEFDKIDQDTALQLSLAYLSYGFGAEAARVLALIEDSTDSKKVLSALARLIDDDKLTEPSPFNGQENCDTDAALWAVFENPELAADANSDAVLRAMGRLPPHLREHIGPLLSRRLAKTGHAEFADAILRAVRRIGNEPDASFELAEASTKEARGETELAATQLSEVVLSGSEQASLALIDLVENRWQDRATVPPDLPDMAAGFAVEFRRAEAGKDLRRAHVLALGMSGRFHEGFAALEDVAHHDGPEAAQEQRLALLELLTARADPVSFLHLALHHSEGNEDMLPEPIGNAMAKRLLDLGFSRPAIRLLAGSDGPAPTAERRYLRAMAALGPTVAASGDGRIGRNGWRRGVAAAGRSHATDRKA